MAGKQARFWLWRQGITITGWNKQTKAHGKKREDEKPQGKLKKNKKNSTINRGGNTTRSIWVALPNLATVQRMVLYLGEMKLEGGGNQPEFWLMVPLRPASTPEATTVDQIGSRTTRLEDPILTTRRHASSVLALPQEAFHSSIP